MANKLNRVKLSMVEPFSLNDIGDNSTHRLVTDDQISKWDAIANMAVKSINNIVPDETGNVAIPLTSINLTGAAANRPIDPAIGTMYFDTTINKPIWYKGLGSWVDSTGGNIAPPADITPPSSVTALAVGTITSNSIVLNWTKSVSTDVANYEVSYSSNNGTSYTIASNTIASTDSTYTVNGLISSTTYTFNLVAIDTSGNRSNPATIVGTTIAGSTTPTAIVSDDFNRTTLGSTDSYSGGTNKVWTTFGSGGLGVSNNQLYAPTGTGNGWVDAGVANARMEVTIATVGNEHDFYFRLDSNINYYRYAYNTAGWFLQESLSSFTTIASFTGVVLKAGDVVAVELQGNTSKLYVNNVLIRTDTLVDLLTNTGFGVGFSGTPIGYLDNFNIYPVTSTPSTDTGGGTTPPPSTGGTVSAKPTNYLSVTDYGASGTSSSNVGPNIQNCINAASSQGKAVVIPAGTYWVDPRNALAIPSNMTIWFDQGAVIKALNAGTATYQILRIWYSSNVKIIGYPTLIGDKDFFSAGTTAEDGMGISLAGATTVYIENANVSKCMGDGIYLGHNGIGNVYNKDVTIVNSTFDSCNRNNMSVISAINLTVKNCKFTNAKGNPAGPAAGIDFEPNLPSEYLQNITMDSCTFTGNYGHGVWGYFGAAGGSPGADKPISITITNSTASGNSGQIYGSPGVQTQIDSGRAVAPGYVKYNGTFIYNK